MYAVKVVAITKGSEFTASHDLIFEVVKDPNWSVTIKFETDIPSSIILY